MRLPTAFRPNYEERVAITKTYDFIFWSCNHTGKFPGNHRFVLGERIELEPWRFSGNVAAGKAPAQAEACGYGGGVVLTTQFCEAL